jgi:hypothetical protein
MADDATKRDYRNRDRVSAERDHEVRYFGQQNGITPEQVPDLIKKVGNSRAGLTKAAKELRKRS